jgi:enolase
MSKITSIKAIQVLDSRGLPTIACRITLDNALTAGVMVPSGASTGA